MIVAVERNSGEILKMSTRRHAHESGRANAKALTLKTLRMISIPSTGLNLLQTLSKSPPERKSKRHTGSGTCPLSSRSWTSVRKPIADEPYAEFASRTS